MQHETVTTSKVWSEFELIKNYQKKKNLIGEFVFKQIWKEMIRHLNMLWNINIFIIHLYY